jgi:hypothetical protein
MVEVTEAYCMKNQDDKNRNAVYHHSRFLSNSLTEEQNKAEGHKPLEEEAS